MSTGGRLASPLALLLLLGPLLLYFTYYYGERDSSSSSSSSAPSSSSSSSQLNFKGHEKTSQDLLSAAGELSVLRKQLRSHLEDVKSKASGRSAGGLAGFGSSGDRFAHSVRSTHSDSTHSSFGLPLMSRSAVEAESHAAAIHLEEAHDVHGTAVSDGSGAATSTLSATATSSPPIATTTSTPKTVVATGASPAVDYWASGLKQKLQCIHEARGGVLLYHMRKAAGTSLRDVLEQFVAKRKVSMYETEGLSLDRRFLTYSNVHDGNEKHHYGTLAEAHSGTLSPDMGALAATGSLLSIVSLRDPVARIMSLYWYEHVGWFDGIQHKPEKCATLQEWVTLWKDSSQHKVTFLKKNPYSVYVEIENYFVKSLIGWKDITTAGTYGGKLNDNHLEQAKAILDAFDVVLLTEWMADSSQIDAVNALFPGRNIIATKHMLKGDKKAKERLKDRLAANEEEVRQQLIKMNALDIALFEYAQSLVSKRLPKIPKLAVLAAEADPFGKRLETVCGAKIRKLPAELDGQLGIHRPPGHKAPLL